MYVIIGPISLALHQFPHWIGKFNTVSISPLFLMSLYVAVSKDSSSPIVILMHTSGSTKLFNCQLTNSPSFFLLNK